MVHTSTFEPEYALGIVVSFKVRYLNEVSIAVYPEKSKGSSLVKVPVIGRLSDAFIGLNDGDVQKKDVKD